MTSDFSNLTESERRNWDGTLDPRGGSWWDTFYSDRAKPCPFFLSHPDECLAEYIDAGRIGQGRAIDMGCGNGRNAIFLARHGLAVEWCWHHE